MNEKELHTFSLAFALFLTVMAFNIVPKFLDSVGIAGVYSGAAAVTSIVSGVRVELSQSTVSRMRAERDQKAELITLRAHKDEDAGTVTFDWAHENRDETASYSYWLYCARNKEDYSLVARTNAATMTYTTPLLSGKEFCRVRGNKYPKNTLSATILRSQVVVVQGPDFVPLEVKKNAIEE